MYNPRKEFDKNLNRKLGSILKENGFKRYKTSNYVRVTKYNIVQIINFQKSSGFQF